MPSKPSTPQPESGSGGTSPSQPPKQNHGPAEKPKKEDHDPKKGGMVVHGYDEPTVATDSGFGGPHGLPVYYGVTHTFPVGGNQLENLALRHQLGVLHRSRMEKSLILNSATMLITRS